MQVQVNKDRELSISGERRQQQQSSSAETSSASSADASTSGRNVHVEGQENRKAEQKVSRRRQERRFGTFKRTWNLPEDADLSQIKASVEQGVLTLKVARIQPAEPEVTNIPIN